MTIFPGTEIRIRDTNFRWVTYFVTETIREGLWKIEGPGGSTEILTADEISEMHRNGDLLIVEV